MHLNLSHARDDIKLCIELEKLVSDRLIQLVGDCTYVMFPENSRNASIAAEHALTVEYLQKLESTLSFILTAVRPIMEKLNVDV